MLIEKEAKSILNKHKQRDGWFLDEYSVNPYEGCSCNCLYCYVRGSKYGENMEEKMAVKVNALSVLEKQLQTRAKKSQHGIVAVGSATDAYLPAEAHYRLTEGFLKLFLRYRFPVFISTKRALVLRDIHLLKQIDEAAILPPDLLGKLNHGVILSVSVSTMNEKMAAMLEPGAIAPLQRMELMSRLKSEGFLVGVNAIPVLPLISDAEEELQKIISAAKIHGADYVLIGGLTLFGKEIADSKTLYYQFLAKHAPDLIPEYDKLYGSNDTLPRSYLAALKTRADKLCRQNQIRNQILE